MRLSLLFNRSLLFLAALAFAVVALLPLRLAVSWSGLDARGLSARSASGSVWIGRLEDARIGPIALGDIEARLNTLPLLLGRARVTLVRARDREPLEGAITVSRGGFGVDDVTGKLGPTTALSPILVESLEFEDFTAGFAGAICQRASGRIRAVLSARIAGAAVPIAFDGMARCDGEALLLPLASRSGSERLAFRLHGDGRYRAELTVGVVDDRLRPRLLAAGFRPSSGGWRLRLDGSF